MSRLFESINFFLVAVIFSTWSAAADEVASQYGPEDGLIRLNDRWFDVHAPADEAWERLEFLPIQRVPWIRVLLDEEPLLDSFVIHIEVQPQASSNVFDRIFDDFEEIESPPDFLTAPGFTVSIGPRGKRLLVKPEQQFGSMEFQGHCRARDDREALWICNIHTEYPDPRIYLMARVYGPPPTMAEFSALLPAAAARLREIAFCLDVTDEVLAGTWAPSPPAEGETLRGCRDDAIS